MFCSNCGNQVKVGLNYCNSCGSRIDSDREKDGSKSRNLLIAIAFIGIGGIIGFISLVNILLSSRAADPVIVVILLAFLATVFGICYLLINQFSHGSEKSAINVEFQNEDPKQVGSATTNQLEEPKQSPASIVENTTRTLDSIEVERK